MPPILLVAADSLIKRENKMALLYKTVEKQCEAEDVIEKSRFIVNVKPVESREEADEFIKYIKNKYKDATHNVPAFVLGEKQEMLWASDDGEPQGTAGVPIVRMIENEGLTNVCVVVTRYFGGIKLGTGGLVRAYTNTAKQGVTEAGIKEIYEQKELDMECEYTYYSRIEQLTKEIDFIIASSSFTDKVKLKLLFAPEIQENIVKKIMEITNGTAILLT